MTDPTRRAVSRLGFGLGLAAAVLAGVAGCQRSGVSFRSTDVTGANYGRRLDLVDHTGQARSLADFRGKVVVVFFGFTQCPDVCPGTLITMANVMRRLGSRADDVQVLFVTLDPDRDLPEVLAQYVPAFDQRFLGLRGTAQETAAAAREFKVFYQRVEGRSAQSYTIDHTAASYVLDREGRLRLYVRHDLSEQDIEADLRTLL